MTKRKGSTTQPQKLTVVIDRDKIAEFSLDDLESIEKAQRGEGASITSILNFLDTVVVGGVRGRGFKIKDTQIILDAVMAEVNRMANPEDGQGKA